MSGMAFEAGAAGANLTAGTAWASPVGLLKRCLRQLPAGHALLRYVRDAQGVEREFLAQPWGKGTPCKTLS